jgi:uncharacterized SAM-binding protein YcdF (DUF218 family)
MCELGAITERSNLQSALAGDGRCAGGCVFFYLSKIFWFVAQPLNFAIFLLLIGLLAALFGRRKLAATGSVLGLLVLVLSAWTSLGAMMLNPLEERFKRPAALPDHVDGIVLLGGGLEGGINLVRGGYELNSAGDRFVEALFLAEHYPSAKILVSGGVSTLFLGDQGDAETAVRFFSAFGIPRERLILEDQSRNTAENAEFSRKLANPQPGESWLLVTSGFHMPRSVGLFRKVGFPVIPWPTDYRTSGAEGVGFFRDNPTDSLETTTMAVREWIGLLAYWLSGRIDTLFPAPE